MPATTVRKTKATSEEALLEYYGLSRQPFGVTPDPDYIYFTPSHREALASLIYEIESARGFSALVAEPGMGKTSLLFHLLEKMKGSSRIAFLFQPDCDSRGLLRNMLADLGVETQPDDVPAMQEMLNKILLDEWSAKRRFLLVIDEAQDLGDDVLESVRLLSNFETTTTKLMHIILAGQPQLAEKLARPELVQLRQRIANIIPLRALSDREAQEYVSHRLRKSGHLRQTLFTQQALGAIARASHGIPRNINHICFLSLTLGFANQSREIDLQIVEEAVRDLADENPADLGSTDTTQSTPHDASWQQWHQMLAAQSTLNDLASPRSTRPLLTGLVIFGFVLIPILLMLMSGYSGLGLAGTASRIGNTISDDLTGHRYDLPDLPLARPISLMPPLPPPLAKQEAEVRQSDRELATEDNQKQLVEKRPETEKAHRTAVSLSTGPRVVFARRQESLFQLALEYYGHSNWVIVAKIREQNPNIRDSFSSVREGQRVILPDLSPEYPWKPQPSSTAFYHR